MTAETAQVRLPLRFRRRAISPAFRRPLAITGMVIVVGWIIVMIAAPLLTHFNPTAPSLELFSAPSKGHLFGTDELGRDVLSRILYGGRTSLPLAMLLVAISVVVGSVLGALAGYFGSWLDVVVMRSVDLVFAFPAIVLAMVVTAVLGPSLRNAVLALAVVSWPTYARVVRGLVLSIGSSEYVEATRLLGGSAPRALRKDIFPNVVGPVVVLATLDIGNAILLLAGLSFLGLGAQPPTPEWGSMVATGTTYFQSWWMGTFPGLAIFTLVLAFNFLGDSLRDAMDPQSTWGSGERA